jgi:outer membrane beta-barrel protein
MQKQLRKILLSFILSLTFSFSYSETKSEDVAEEKTRISADEIEIESLYDDGDTESVAKEDAVKNSPDDYDLKIDEERKRIKNEKIDKLSDLVKLSPFSDIAVISKKFLPKTKRFEIAPLGVMSLNNPFFDNYGIGIHLGYGFSERYGVEFLYNFLTDSEKGITTNLRENQNVSTRSLVVPKSFLGAVFKWSPIYGKMAWFQEAIVPYEIYFTPGIGLAQTEENNEIAFQLGTGQLFAVTRSMAFRWDLNWRFYNATVKETLNSQTTTSSQFHSDFILQFGISLFFPGVKAR